MAGVPPRRLDAVTRSLIAWCVGIVLSMAPGLRSVDPLAWVAGSAALLALGAAQWWRRRPLAVVQPLSLACVALTAAGWTAWRSGEAPANHVAQLIGAESRLVDLTGTIANTPSLAFAEDKGLGRFIWSPPASRFIVRVERVHTEAGPVRCGGALLVSVPQLDVRWRTGDRVRVRGWLAAIGEPSNPGEVDFRAQMQRLGVVGKLYTRQAGNVGLVARARPWLPPLRQWHATLCDQVADALRLGMADPGDARAAMLLDAMVLGRRSDGLDELYESFRRTGLAHVLAISGLHVGLLAVGVWFFVQVATARPRLAAVAALAAVLLYLAVVPWRVPILRAAFMTAVCCVGLARHRRVPAMTLMSIIGLTLLVARPTDLFDAGFQLSFGIVAALLLFTNRVSRAVLPEPLYLDFRSTAMMLRRFGVDYLTVSAIAWLTALPIVAYHFRMISPLAIAFSVLTFPVVVALLWLGFAKIIAGLLSVSAGAALAPPLAWLADRWAAAVERAADLPGAWVALPPPSPAWAIASAAVVFALFGGWFAGRRRALAASVLLCVGWLYAPAVLARLAPGPPLVVHMIDVGDDSCFVLRSGGHGLLFDCGSANYGQIGTFTIVPALRSIGIERLDAVVVSHADLDHFAGVIDVVDALPVGRVLMTGHTRDAALAQVGAAAGGRPAARGATGQLWLSLRERGVPIDFVEAGDRFELGEAGVAVIWPPPGRRFEDDNDNSVVMSFTAAGRTVLMCGDIQAEAMQRMLDAPVELAADVTDLPHHGSFPPPAVAWLAEADPSIVLQSSGPRRLRWDKWAPPLSSDGPLAGVRRYITARDGAVTLTIDRHGGIDVRTFRAD